jgi:aspartate--ammonia ligase
MGIRVDASSLNIQLDIANKKERAELYFHKLLLENKLPLTIGGGIGQSRLSMLLLEKMHIGEVQVSVWNEKTIEECEKLGITLL